MSNPLRCRIRNGASSTRVDIYDDIGGGLYGGVRSRDLVIALSGASGPLDVHINSGGGELFEGRAIAEALRSYRGKVTCRIDGLAASIASVIVQSGSKRIIAPGGMMMIHDATTRTDGNTVDHRKAVALLNKVSDSLADTYAQRAGGTRAQWRKRMRSETWYTAEEALGAGLVDAIAGDDASWPGGVSPNQFARAPRRIQNLISDMLEGRPARKVARGAALAAALRRGLGR